MVDLTVENRPYAEADEAVGNKVLWNRGYLFHTASIGTPTTVQSLISGASTNLNYPANQITAYVKSTNNVADVAAGTGAQRAKLTYLDLAGSIKTAEADLNGTTAVQICTDFYRALGLEVVRVGSGGYNVGQLTIVNLAGTETYYRMNETTNNGGSCVLTVPAGYTGIVREPFLSQNNGRAIQQLWIREQNGVWQLRGQMDIWGGEQDSRIPAIQVPAMTDVELRGTTDAVAGVLSWHRLEIVCLPLAP